jgi:hypothetical protein
MWPHVTAAREKNMTTASAEALNYIAMIGIMSNRLACSKN